MKNDDALRMKNNEQQLLLSLGRVIKQRRVDLGLSQEELASRSGLHRTYMRDVEAGNRNLSFDTFVKITGALRLQASETIALAEQLLNGHE